MVCLSLWSPVSVPGRGRRIGPRAPALPTRIVLAMATAAGSCVAATSSFQAVSGPYCLSANERSHFRFKLLDGRAEGHLHDTGVASDLDRTRDRRPVLDFGHRHLEKLGRTLESVVGGTVEVRPGADH